MAESPFEIRELAMQPRWAAAANFFTAMVYLATCALGCTNRFDAATASPRPGRPLGDGRAAVVYSSRYEIDLGGFEKLHSFDIHKYGRMARALVNDGYLTVEDLFVPGEVTRDELLLVHTPAYLETLHSPKAVGRYLESGVMSLLPSKALDEGVLRAFRCSTGGSIVAARQALVCGLGVNIGGGYHHAHPDHGEGFCIYADVPIAVRVLQREGLIRRVLLVDLDVHQGNGNAVCFRGDDDVFTFSIHEGDIYPRPKAQSDLDVELLPPVDDEQYMSALREHLPRVLGKSRPDLVVVLAGVDTHADDPLARFSMTADGIVERDAYAVGQARRFDIPVLYVTSGGYSKEAWRIQFSSIANLLELFAGVRPAPATSGSAAAKSNSDKSLRKSGARAKGL